MSGLKELSNVLPVVLVVDDDRARLLRDEEMLAALGYEPVGFTHASEALATCGAKPERFDALLVGHLASTLSAVDLAANLHAASPRLPIVLASGYAELPGGLDSGLTRLAKPFTQRELSDAIRQAIKVCEQ